MAVGVIGMCRWCLSLHINDDLNVSRLAEVQG